MKRFLTLAAAAALALTLFSACGAKGNTQGYDWPIIGKWRGNVADYHYPVVTFNADGTYVWEWDGIAKWKDTGTYTYAEDKVVMKISKYFEWDEENSNWKEMGTPEEYDGVRTCPITELKQAYMIWDVNDDWFAGDPQTVMARLGVQQVKPEDLLGTWESTYSEESEEGFRGKPATRLIFSKEGSSLSYIEYEFYYDDPVWVDRKAGEWTLEDGILTLKGGTWKVSRVYHQVSKQWLTAEVDLDNLEATQWYNAINPPYDISYSCIKDDGKLWLSMEIFTKK